jgi:hypothetical protein
LTRSSEAAALSMVRMPASFPATIEVRPRRTLGEMLAFGAVRCLRDIQLAGVVSHPCGRARLATVKRTDLMAIVGVE